MWNKLRLKKYIETETKNKAENEIGDEGAKAFRDALKVNTTLESLNLRSAKKQRDKTEQCNKHLWDKTGNRIFTEGTCALSEALKVNTTLASLNLLSVQQQGKVKQAQNQPRYPSRQWDRFWRSKSIGRGLEGQHYTHKMRLDKSYSNCGEASGTILR